MKPEFNLKDSFIRNKLKHVVFLDIETSLVDARVYRTGTQFVGMNQVNNYTKLLTVAGATMYDLYTKGEKGIWSFSNHHCPDRFKKDPLDDTFVLQRIWDILDKADVVVAHNARFDEGWVMGRFLQLGWPLPSKFSIVCTYRGLHKYNFTSKKLDSLSKQLIGTQKIPTTFELWERCSEGDVSAFEEMERYNRGDIYPTLFNVYMRTCAYYPDYGVDLVNYNNTKSQCKVDGGPLEATGTTWLNRKTNLEYLTYKNPRLGIVYRDRYNNRSNKSNIGLVRHLI